MRALSKALEIEGWMTATELEWLRLTARRLVSTRGGIKAAEVGSLLGRSTVALAIDGVDLVCVDTFLGTPGVEGEALHGRDMYAEFVANMTRLGLRPVVMRMDATQAAASFPNAYFDLVFLDCDKAAFPFQYGAWYPKVKPGGVYCGHDHSLEFPLVQQTLMATNIDYNVAFGTSIWWFLRPYIT